MTKPWHHLQILHYCLIVLSFLSLDKHNSVSSEHSVYNLTFSVVTNQLVINPESNISSSALLLLYSFRPQKSEDTWSLQRGCSTRSWSHIFLRVVSDVVPTLLQPYSNPTPTHLRPPTYSVTTLSSIRQPPTSEYIRHTSDIGHCSSDPLILLLNLNTCQVCNIWTSSPYLATSNVKLCSSHLKDKMVHNLITSDTSI